MKIINITILFAVILCSSNASAIPIGGVEFPGGAISFADAVVSYDPIIKLGEPILSRRDPSEALGIPDYTDGPGIDFVSLGDGGSITLQFIDNILTGSGNSDLDLWVFEIGPDVEDTFVEISMDNSTWFSVGTIFGSTSGVDIDAFGFGILDSFAYVRLTDDPDEGNQTGRAVGADIDAVGAITTRAVPVPEPASLTLIVLGLMSLGVMKRKC